MTGMISWSTDNYNNTAELSSGFLVGSTSCLISDNNLQTTLESNKTGEIFLKGPQVCI